MKEDTDSHRRVWKGHGGVGRADISEAEMMEDLG